MKVADNEVGIGQRQVDDHVTEEEPGQTTVGKGEDETDRKQHGHPQVDVALP